MDRYKLAVVMDEEDGMKRKECKKKGVIYEHDFPSLFIISFIYTRIHRVQ